MKDKERSVVLIVSAMRTGSTLLKSLLAVAPDVSDLPEINYHSFTTADLVEKVYPLTDARVVILKKPCWDIEVGTYPVVPDFPRLKKIVLVRDVYAVVSSLKIRRGQGAAHLKDKSDDDLIDYWCGVHEGLLAHEQLQGDDTVWVQYEKLVEDPIRVTGELFSFTGSCQQEGVDRYNKPSAHKWEFGKDDLGEKLLSLKVQKGRPPANEREKRVMESAARVAALRARLGYV